MKHMFDDRIDKAIDRLFQFLILDNQVHTEFLVLVHFELGLDQSCKSTQKPLVVSGFLVVAPKTFSGFPLKKPLNH